MRDKNSAVDHWWRWRPPRERENAPGLSHQEAGHPDRYIQLSKASGGGGETDGCDAHGQDADLDQALVAIDDARTVLVIIKKPLGELRS